MTAKKLLTITFSFFLFGATAIAQNEDKGKTFYIVTAEEEYAILNGEKMRGWEFHPLTKLSWRELITGEVGDDLWMYRDIRKQFKKLKSKGYQVKTIKKIESVKLLELLSDDATMGIFHHGHGLVITDSMTSEQTAYLSVYENGEIVPLNEEVLERAKRKLGKNYVPSKNLKLFFTTACYAGLCQAGIRENLQLGGNVRYITSSGPMQQGERAIWGTFKNEIASWIEELPPAGTRPGCLSRILGRF